MSSPLVSAVVPTYETDSDGTVARAVRSVAAQTYDPVELVVVDDCSPEPVADTVKDADAAGLADVTVVRHDENHGANAARNTGIEAADGEFVAFLDADDEWRPQKIERQVARYRETDESVRAVYTGIEQVGPAGETTAVSTADREGDLRKRLLLGNVVGSFSVLFVAADALGATGPLDERFPSWQDWEFYVRLSANTEFAAVAAPLVVRHNEGEQISRNYRAKAETSAPLLVEKYGPVAAEYGRLFHRRFRGHLAHELGYAALANGEYAAGRRHLLCAVALDPFQPNVYPHLLAALGGERVYEGARRLKRTLVS
ncbi:glycosyltransferase family 2 protein [Halomicroarcula sp. GCM10025817]|uniref:glycosyltransferase family 2 protein n=1 Tax=Haloarcula TaxID=2237 RepID=UPI0023E7EB74|nr:glycosyltransferase family 2 protein [Halomicroarcula sp. SYNS111]